MAPVFSGEEVIKGMVNSTVGWNVVRMDGGSHAILKLELPEDHEENKRTVSVPLHDELAIGTLRGIADDAGAKDFQEFCAWIESNI